MTKCIVFWQRMLTPHMTELALEVARAGALVHYVTEQALSEERRAMGWQADDLSEVEVHYIGTPDEARGLVDRLSQHAVHITQGVRANGLVSEAQKRIMAKGLRHYPVMEMVDLRGFGGWIKPLVYALQFRAFAEGSEGLLAIGEGTPNWIARRAPRRLRAIPFAYFLKGRRPHPAVSGQTVFRFIFVGGLVERKRVDLLIEALSGLADRPFDLEIVGDGPERVRLESRAEEVLPGRVTFSGTISMDTAIDRIAAADCLVLPSDHDGWGAVVSEAQINGTPVICSSQCGSAGAVRASGFGAVFKARNEDSLRQCLANILDMGRIDAASRDRLSVWAQCLTAGSGARYLLDIISNHSNADGPIIPPWERGIAIHRGTSS